MARKNKFLPALVWIAALFFFGSDLLFAADIIVTTAQSDGPCKRGFYQVGQECREVVVPPHARLDAVGKDWVCEPGFYRSGGECAEIPLPPNAVLNKEGTDWVCKPGYFRSGDECAEIALPPNAVLNKEGDGWICQDGYKQHQQSCIPMSQSDREQATEQKRQELLEYQKRVYQGVDGDHCSVDKNTKGKICVEITEKQLSCQKAASGKLFIGCNVILNYQVETNRQKSENNATVRCSAHIEFRDKDKKKYLNTSIVEKKHILSAYGGERDEAILNFSFGSMREVDMVDLIYSDCRVDTGF